AAIGMTLLLKDIWTMRMSDAPERKAPERRQRTRAIGAAGAEDTTGATGAIGATGAEDMAGSKDEGGAGNGDAAESAGDAAADGASPAVKLAA
ncbi:MAG TPA: hypothetical protein VH372_04495, partial [Actinospica sp.]|nr:hypothetical protein [Actinospica sp.]